MPCLLLKDSSLWLTFTQLRPWSNLWRNVQRSQATQKVGFPRGFSPISTSYFTRLRWALETGHCGKHWLQPWWWSRLWDQETESLNRIRLSGTASVGPTSALFPLQTQGQNWFPMFLISRFGQFLTRWAHIDVRWKSVSTVEDQTDWLFKPCTQRKLVYLSSMLYQ